MAEFIAGLFGGCAGVAVGHPLDTIKVKLQTQDFRNPKYKGTWDCFQKTLKTDGARGLYRGMASPMGGVGAVNAIVFGVQKAVNDRMDNPNALGSHFVSGACAGLAQSFICSPVELVKTRLQIQAEAGGPRLYKGPIDCLHKIYQQSGLKGICRGQMITIYREIPALGTYFVSYEACARWLSGTSSSDESGAFSVLLAGGVAGSASWLISYPIDVIKSRWQTDGVFGPSKYTGLVDCLKKSVAEEGYQSLTRGLSSTLIRAFPTNAATFLVVSTFMKYFGKQIDTMDVETSAEKILNSQQHLADIGHRLGHGAQQVAQEVVTTVIQPAPVEQLAYNGNMMSSCVRERSKNTAAFTNFFTAVLDITSKNHNDEIIITPTRKENTTAAETRCNCQEEESKCGLLHGDFLVGGPASSPDHHTYKALAALLKVAFDNDDELNASTSPCSSSDCQYQ